MKVARSHWLKGIGAVLVLSVGLYWISGIYDESVTAKLGSWEGKGDRLRQEYRIYITGETHELLNWLKGIYPDTGDSCSQDGLLPYVGYISGDLRITIVEYHYNRRELIIQGIGLLSNSVGGVGSDPCY